MEENTSYIKVNGYEQDLRDRLVFDLFATEKQKELVKSYKDENAREALRRYFCGMFCLTTAIGFELGKKTPVSEVFTKMEKKQIDLTKKVVLKAFGDVPTEDFQAMVDCTFTEGDLV